MYDSVFKLNQNERLVYLQDTKEIINGELQGDMSCPVLVITCEYDHFITPFGNDEIKMFCKNSTFVYVSEAEYMYQSFKSKILLKVFESFLNDKDYDEIRGIEQIEIRDDLKFEKRIAKRWNLEEEYRVILKQKDVELNCTMEDISYGGCFLKTIGNSPFPFEDIDNMDYELYFVKDNFSTDVLILDVENGIRCLFLKTCFYSYKNVLMLIDRLKGTHTI